MGQACILQKVQAMLWYELDCLAPAIFSLIGVALGMAGSLFGVYYAQRTARQQVRLQHATAMRNERKEVFLEYLEAQPLWPSPAR